MSFDGRSRNHLTDPHKGKRGVDKWNWAGGTKPATPMSSRHLQCRFGHVWMVGLDVEFREDSI
jgi:hypothetical protein